MKKKLFRMFVYLLVIIALFLIVLTILEYNPSNKESLTSIGNANFDSIDLDNKYSITTFNIGYGALSETEDFFMDGGKTVRPENKSIVENNIKNIKKEIKKLNSNFVFIQEVDKNSKRSYNINQVDDLVLNNMEASFAYNYKAKYVPFPLPTIGKVNSGILTMGEYKIKSSDRISLPNPFSWPTRTVNLKRAMLVNRYPIENKDSELVLINFHLEAFDTGEGKKKQTKLISEMILNEYKKGNYVIAGGDWNQTLIKNLVVDNDLLTEWKPGTLEWESLPDWEFAVDRDIPSNRSLLKPYTGYEDKLSKFYIDGFIVSPNIKIKEIKVSEMKFKYSDHEPVKMDFELIN